MDWKESMSKEFYERFDARPDLAAFAPGRVNLIGEHIDYNGGHVFPCALSLGTAGMIRRTEQPRLRFYSRNFRGIGVIEMDRTALDYDQRDHWSNYPKGVLKLLMDEGLRFEGGLDVLYDGNIPPASGLSSSASVEVLTAVLLRGLFDLSLSNQDIALLSQRAENEYIGVNCGIMDQFAIAMGKKDQAILLDTASLEHHYAPLNLEDYVLIIASSNKKRGLGSSAYNERRAQCEEALRIFQKERPELQYLCELDMEAYEALAPLLTDLVIAKRAKHAVSEEARTLAAYEALSQGDLPRFGDLMCASHVSLRDDYDVSCRELDVLVEASMDVKGCLGSRMTGAGFGGCTVSLVHQDSQERFIEDVGAAYLAQIGYAADFYPVKAGEGAGLVTL